MAYSNLGVNEHFSDAAVSRGIVRRDFLNGALLASGGLVVGRSTPLQALVAAVADSDFKNTCDGDIGLDPRVLRSGNLPASFNVAHWLRDRRLRFGPGKVTLALGCDAQEGQFEIADESEAFNVIIVGAGLSGLSAAFYILRRRPGTKILLLDANRHAGGNAARDEGPPLPVMASAGAAYCVAPSADYQRQLYGGLGVEWERHKIENPFFSYYFDENAAGEKPGWRGWNIDTYGKGLQDVPYAPHVVQDLLRCRAEFKKWARTDGAPTEPSNSSDPRFDHLAEMTLDAYLTKILRCDPIVSDFYSRYAIDALGGAASQVNAHSSISFLAAEYGDRFSFPGGTSELARRLVHWLTTAQQNRSAAIRLDAVALRVEIDASRAKSKARVTYYKDKVFHRAAASAVILACQSHTARHLVAHLIDASRQRAWSQLNTVPAVVANVGIRTATPFVEAGLGYNQYWWGSRYWASFVIADWVTPRRDIANRPTVLTFFGGNTASPEDLPKERMRLLHTPFAEYEQSLKQDLSRIMAGAKFDFDRDVTSISLYRWGHGMIMPTTTSVFGDAHDAHGRLDRAKSPRHVACAQLGCISFAGQDSEGAPSVESAIASGFRSAAEVLALL